MLVQSNFGARHSLRLGGIKVGERLLDDMPRPLDTDLIPPEHAGLYARWLGTDNDTRQQAPNEAGDGSIIVIVVTDAPLLPHQLKRIAKRPALGIGRLGGVGTALSGDIFLALSTANGGVSEMGCPQPIDHFPNLNLTPMFEAVIDATEEAIVNAMVAAEALEGANRLYVPALPIVRVRAILAEHGYCRSGQD